MTTQVMTTVSDKRDELERQLRIAQGELERVRFEGNRERSTHLYHERVSDLLAEISDTRQAIAALPLDGQIALPGVMR